jgi:hypothetical protein
VHVQLSKSKTNHKVKDEYLKNHTTNETIEIKRAASHWLSIQRHPLEEATINSEWMNEMEKIRKAKYRNVIINI